MNDLSKISFPSPDEKALLADFSRLYKIQPATALWRAVEIAEVLKAGFPNGQGLDIGCGDGALTGLILKYLAHKPDMIGLDYDPGEVNIAERRGVYQSCICSSADDIPLEDNSQDFVFSNSVLEHLTNLEGTMAEVGRVLKPGGIFLATVPAPPFRSLLRAGRRTGEAREAYVNKMDSRLAHHNYLGRSEWAAILERNGMVLESAKDYLNEAQVQRWETLSNMTAGMLQRFGASNALLYRLQRLSRSDDKSAGGVLDASEPAKWSRAWAKVVAGSVLDGASDDGAEGACLLIRGVKKDTGRAAQG